MAVASVKELRESIADHVDRANGEIAVREVAESILNDLSTDAAEALAFKAICREVNQYLADHRPPTNGTTHGNRSGRWEQVKDAKDLLEEWWVSFQTRSSKPLLNCSSQDLAEAAEWYEKRADGYTARAKAYRKLARRLGGTKLVADVPREEVRRILNA